jgi:NADH:ubiquinone oxidoreductase subunit F (NADH-binding)/(2Fe-2S) ferredoxin/NAD-dependent dihydropyrimidine dehydrogenase PreA subunit
MTRLGSPEELVQFRHGAAALRQPDRRWIGLCMGTGCRASGAEAVSAAVRNSLLAQKLAAQIDVVELKETGCQGFCERGPLMVIHPEGVFYQHVKPVDVEEIIAETVTEGRIVGRLLYRNPENGEKIVKEHDIPFYRNQRRLLLAHSGEIDPTDVRDYVVVGGYSALARALFTMKPDEIIELVIQSGLRGRGGAGYPTGSKWRSCRNAQGDTKYVICNADEGDPGAYMDRSIIESNPHSVLEGMIIGAYAIGSNQGYIYVRQEYPLAVKHFRRALEQADAYGFLGKNILGSGFDFNVKINRGGGAFVCGESTALVASIEGRTGEPRAKHVHTVESGLWDCPTNLNNVKTWANVPHIVNRGASWYARTGTENSKGTAMFSLVGKVNNTGLVEVPMGITLRELIYDVGGGISSGKRFKAVQTGGPSGGCIPNHLLDLPVDFESLTEVGSMMGSGGMIVMDEDTCMVDVARYFMAFLMDESCGKCASCREGLLQMNQVLQGICQGQGSESDLSLLRDLCDVVAGASLCALGTTAPNPVLSTLRYFDDEYRAHIHDKRCPAGVCKALITFQIVPDKCTGCGVCLRRCPQEAISGDKKQPHVIDQPLCIKCGVCHDVCKFDAIRVI